MSPETRLLLDAFQALSHEVVEMRRDLAQLASRIVVAPDLLTTDQAVSLAHTMRPKLNRCTLARWVADGRLSNIQHPRRYRRDELERALSGVPVSTEQRGRRREPRPLLEVMQ